MGLIIANEKRYEVEDKLANEINFIQDDIALNEMNDDNLNKLLKKYGELMTKTKIDELMEYAKRFDIKPVMSELDHLNAALGGADLKAYPLIRDKNGEFHLVEEQKAG